MSAANWHEHDAAGCTECPCASAPMNSASCTCVIPAAPSEAGATLTEAEREADATWALDTPSLWESPDDRSIPTLLAAIGQVLRVQDMQRRSMTDFQGTCRSAVEPCNQCDDCLRARHILRRRVAAAETKARAEGAAAVRDDIQARRREFRRLNADPQYLNALDDAYGLANNRARQADR